VEENPINFYDLYGLFRFGTRPLENTGGVSASYGTNINLLHENGFYDSGGNVGFFPSGIGPDDPAQLGNYEMFGPYYDDAIMMEAVSNLQASGKWQPDLGEKWYENPSEHDYDVTLHNCQDFADALREEYKDLGGKPCNVPFQNGVCSKPIVCTQTRRGKRCR
jgi:hypothetical protein